MWIVEVYDETRNGLKLVKEYKGTLFECCRFIYDYFSDSDFPLLTKLQIYKVS